MKFPDQHFRITATACSTAVLLFAAGCSHDIDNARNTNQQAQEISEVATIPSKPLVTQQPVLSEEVVADMAAVEAASQFGALRSTAQPLMSMSKQTAADSVFTTLQEDRENYHAFDDNPLKRASEEPVSTFSIDVDTGSYANVRRFLNQGQWPRTDAVRTEELINYFDYQYAASDSLDTPFSLTTEVAPSPWNSATHLLHIGVKGYEQSAAKLPPSNLVFLIDVSGSMNSPDKLGLLKTSLTMLAKQMNAQDRIAIAVYAGAAGVVLEPTSGNKNAKIIQALNQLSAGGSTNGGAGIQLAYQLAAQSYIKGGINRVIVATDGDFNVGTVNFEALTELVEQQREKGIALTTLGFGSGNYNDHLMEQLADVGNGNYAYIDSVKEAHKVLVEERASTLMTIAKDVKIQIEFNPAQVAEYRLIGYENRTLAREDFNNDKVDAGDIGAGHSVTAIYEITLVDSDYRAIEPLRYGDSQPQSDPSSELAFLRLRYKKPDENQSRLIERPIDRAQIATDLQSSSENFRFAAAVSAFGQTLRGGQYLHDFDYADIRKLAGSARGADRFGYRGEFLQLLGVAAAIDPRGPLSQVENASEDAS
ncbi:MAG: VWA domain-containing protein [Pseudomonadota bacterium]